MKTVFKYELEIPDGPSGTLGKVKLPYGAQILKVECQTICYYVWCLIDPHETRNKEHDFLVVGTGHNFDESVLEGLEYKGTVITLNGRLVFHFWLEL